jgi:hypothetical protein
MRTGFLSVIEKFVARSASATETQIKTSHVWDANDIGGRQKRIEELRFIRYTPPS